MNAPSGKVVVAYVDVGLWLSSVGMSTSTIAFGLFDYSYHVFSLKLIRKGSDNIECQIT